MGSIANFRGKSEKALKINVRGFNFCDSNQAIHVPQLTETWTKGMR